MHEWMMRCFATDYMYLNRHNDQYPNCRLNMNSTYRVLIDLRTDVADPSSAFQKRIYDIYTSRDADRALNPTYIYISPHFHIDQNWWSCGTHTMSMVFFENRTATLWIYSDLPRFYEPSSRSRSTCTRNCDRRHHKCRRQKNDSTQYRSYLSPYTRTRINKYFRNLSACNFCQDRSNKCSFSTYTLEEGTCSCRFPTAAVLTRQFRRIPFQC